MEHQSEFELSQKNLAKAFKDFFNEVVKLIKESIKKVVEFYNKHKAKIIARAKYERRVRNRQKLHSKNKKKRRRR